MFIAERVWITEAFKPDKEAEQHVQDFAEDLNRKLDEIGSSCGVDLEARFSRVRTEETNLGNLIADLFRTEYGADVGLSHGGNLRANSVYDKGPLKLKFLVQVWPMTDKVILLKMPGRILK